MGLGMSLDYRDATLKSLLLSLRGGSPTKQSPLCVNIFQRLPRFDEYIFARNDKSLFYHVVVEDGEGETRARQVVADYSLDIRITKRGGIHGLDFLGCKPARLAYILGK